MLTRIFLSKANYLDRFRKLLKQLVRNKLIRRDTSVIVGNALQLELLQVRDVMVPRAKMVLMEKDDDFHKILSAIMVRPHSRFPVIDKQNEKIIGILLAKDLLRYASRNSAGQDPQLFRTEEVVRPPLLVPESKKLIGLLNDFKKHHSHMAIVVDEYGSIAGLVTIEDVLEQVVGDIIDESDPDEDQRYIYSSQNDGRQKIYQIDALMPVEDFNQKFQTTISDEEFDTIGGIVMHAFSYVPRKNESITIENIAFAVMDADKRHIKRLQIVIKH